MKTTYTTYQVSREDWILLKAYYFGEIFAKQEGDLYLLRLFPERANFVQNKFNVKLTPHEPKHS